MSLKVPNSSSRSTAKTEFSKAIALITRASTGRDRLIIELLYSTGITPHELVNLQVKHLGANNTLELPSFLTKNKTSRSIPLSKVLAHKLRQYVAAKKLDEFVFSTRQSPQLSTRRVEQVINDACAKAKLSERITAQDIRREYLSVAAQNARNDEELKTFTGLRSITKRRVLDKAQLGRLRRVLTQSSSRDRMLVELTLGSAAKLSELVAVKKKQLQSSSIVLDNRTIPIPASLAYELSQLDLGDDDYVFSTQQSPQLSVRRAEQIINKIGVRAKLELSAEVLRATAIERIANELGEAEARQRAGLKTRLAYTHSIIGGERT